MRETPADKARKTRTRQLADMIQLGLAAAAELGRTEEYVVRLFEALPVSPVRKCDAFWLLDNEPGRYGANYFGWHSLLRRTRNHPTHGKALFALFRKGEQV